MPSQLLSSLPGRKSQQQNTEGSFCLPSGISSHPSMYDLHLCDHNSKGNQLTGGTTCLRSGFLSIVAGKGWPRSRERRQMGRGAGRAGRAGSYSIFKGLLWPQHPLLSPGQRHLTQAPPKAPRAGLEVLGTGQFKVKTTTLSC